MSWVGVVAGGQGTISTSALQHPPQETDTCRPWGQDLAEVPLQPSKAAWPPSRPGDPTPSPPSASAHVEAVGAELQDGGLGAS